MIYAIFSDIHGNQYTLSSMLNSIKNYNIKVYIFLCDICGYYYGQNECIEILEKLQNAYFLRGNHDQYWLDVLSGNRTIKELAMNYGNTYYKKLKDKNVEFLKNTLLKIETEISGKKILGFHGGLNSYLEERIYPDMVEDYYKEHYYKLCEYDYIFTGHTHYSFYKKMCERTIWINPGSLGQPRDGNGFRYCLVDFEDASFKMCSVKWDRMFMEKEVLLNNEPDKISRYLINVLYR